MQLVSSSDAGKACLDALDDDGCTPALVAAHAAYSNAHARASLLHCVSMCIHLGCDYSAQAVAMATAATASAAAAATAATAATSTAIAANSSIACTLVPVHYYAAALGAADVLQLLIQRLLQPPSNANKSTAGSVSSPKASSPNASTSSRAPSGAARRTSTEATTPLDPLNEIGPQNGMSVLHYAAAHGQLECVRLLLVPIS